ncbi:MAG TPA: hypothetical protein VFV08_13385, partial [Puia sp.]|nr:hypothetical protein [Puia sp.]
MNKRMKIMKYFSLCLAFSGFGVLARAQKEFIHEVQDRFEEYSVTNLQEKIYVHVDKSFYVPGEIIWFKVYCVDGYANKPLNLSKVAYVEVLSSDQKPLLQAKIDMKNGSGNGSFLIPYTANSGNYQFRAYTSWMKNYPPEFFFEKTISIVNPSKRPDWPQGKAPDYDIQFFPEGGNLVYGLESVVGFRAADRSGKGVNCSGVIVNNKGDTITHFQSLKFGLGQLKFTPKTGETYSAIIETPDKNQIKSSLDNIYPTGYVMSVMKGDNDQILIRIQNNGIDQRENILLFAQTRHVIKLIRETTLDNGKAEFQINQNVLGEGISQLTIFDKDHRPVCERLV